MTGLPRTLRVTASCHASCLHPRAHGRVCVCVVESRKRASRARTEEGVHREALRLRQEDAIPFLCNSPSWLVLREGWKLGRLTVGARELRVAAARAGREWLRRPARGACGSVGRSDALPRRPPLWCWVSGLRAGAEPSSPGPAAEHGVPRPRAPCSPLLPAPRPGSHGSTFCLWGHPWSGRGLVGASCLPLASSAGGWTVPRGAATPLPRLLCRV